MIDEITMRELSAGALCRLAEGYETLARQCRAAADRKVAALSRERESVSRANELRALPDIVAGYRAAGLSDVAAIQAAAKAAGVGIECVEAHIKVARRRSKARGKQARDARIIELAATGLKTRQIARQIDTHHATVARVLQRSS